MNKNFQPQKLSKRHGKRRNVSANTITRSRVNMIIYKEKEEKVEERK